MRSHNLQTQCWIQCGQSHLHTESMYIDLCLHSGGQERVFLSLPLGWESRVEIYSPLRALAGGAEVSISQPVNSKTKHIIRFQSFAEQITITTTILGDKKKIERNIFICLKVEVQGEQSLFTKARFGVS